MDPDSEPGTGETPEPIDSCVVQLGGQKKHLTSRAREEPASNKVFHWPEFYEMDLKGSAGPTCLSRLKREDGFIKLISREKLLRHVGQYTSISSIKSAGLPHRHICAANWGGTALWNLLRTLWECLCASHKSCSLCSRLNLKHAGSFSCPALTHPVLETTASPTQEALPELSSSSWYGTRHQAGWSHCYIHSCIHSKQ